jgi:hypothetical protein
VEDGALDMLTLPEEFVVTANGRAGLSYFWSRIFSLVICREDVFSETREAQKSRGVSKPQPKVGPNFA